MSDLHIILHCLPREIDELDRIVNHLKRSSHFLEDNDEVILDFTLNLSDKLTDWETSKLPKEFFADKFEMMKQRCDWTSKNIFEINDSNRCLGINDKRCDIDNLKIFASLILRIVFPFVVIDNIESVKKGLN